MLELHKRQPTIVQAAREMAFSVQHNNAAEIGYVAIKNKYPEADKVIEEHRETIKHLTNVIKLLSDKDDK